MLVLGLLVIYLLEHTCVPYSCAEIIVQCQLGFSATVEIHSVLHLCITLFASGLASAANALKKKKNGGWIPLAKSVLLLRE